MRTRSLRPRTRWVVATVCALALVASLVVALARHGTEGAAPVAAPWEFSVGQWDAALGGDTAPTSATFAALSSAHPGLSSADAGQLRALAVAVVTADLTGTDRSAWPGYWPPPATTTTRPAVQCSSVAALAASPAALPVAEGQPGSNGTYAKVLVALKGSCGTARHTLADPRVEYVFASRSANGWAPVRMWDVPAAVDHDSSQAQNEPQDWQLKTLGPCGVIDGDRYRARTAVADAFEAMCAAARKDNVVLVLEAGYRTRAEQAALFERAVKYYGTQEKARLWVAYADERSCESKACAGLSVGVEPDHAATSWLRTVVACSAGGSTSRLERGSSCPAGATPVLRSQLYGFAAPVERIPGYLEFVLPLGDGDGPPADCAPQGVPVPDVVASVFRCRLAQAGIAGKAADTVVAEALVVSKCSSGWNASAQLFAGRYARQPNPADGRVYSERGVFALRGELADAGWVKGGRAKLSDPVANVNAAASLWLASRGWEQFPCAVGSDPQLKVAASLPQYGGPALPEWATQY